MDEGAPQAERELDSATTRTALDAAAKKLMRAKAALVVNSPVRKRKGSLWLSLLAPRRPSYRLP